MNKQLKRAKDRNCKVVTSAALSDVSMNKQKNQRNFSIKLHLVLFTQNVRKNYRKRHVSPEMHFLRVNKKWVTHGKEASMRQVLPVLFPIKTKEAYGNEQMVPLVKGVTSFFTRKDTGNLLIIV